MGRVCGHCAEYVHRPFCEDVCAKTGKIVPYLAQRDCFVDKVEPDANKLTQNTKILTQNTNTMEEKRTKVCKECGRELPMESFGKQYKSSDGYMHVCRDCMSKKAMERATERVKKEKEKPTGEIFDRTDEHNGLSQYSDRELKDELVYRGWEVTCRKLIEL